MDCAPDRGFKVAELEHTADRFGGIIIAADQVPTDLVQFAARLDASLSSWREAGKRGVWLRLNDNRAHLAGAAISAGFQFHHAEVRLVGKHESGDKKAEERGRGRRE